MKKEEKKKYKGEYLVHWLAMYLVYHDNWTKESIEHQVDLYKSIEGDDEFKGLQEEIRLIIKNNDLSNFLRDTKKEGMKLSDLQFMAETILSRE